MKIDSADRRLTVRSQEPLTLNKEIAMSLPCHYISEGSQGCAKHKETVFVGDVLLVLRLPFLSYIFSAYERNT